MEDPLVLISGLLLTLIVVLLMCFYDLCIMAGINDLALVEIVMHIEEHFEIELSDEECENTPTVGDLIRRVAKKKQGNGAPT